MRMIDRFTVPFYNVVRTQTALFDFICSTHLASIVIAFLNELADGTPTITTESIAGPIAAQIRKPTGLIAEYSSFPMSLTSIRLTAIRTFYGNIVLPGPGSILCHIELRTLLGAKVMGNYLITAPGNSFYNSACFAAKSYLLAIIAPLFLSCSQCFAAYCARMARGFKLLWHINLLVGHWSLSGASRTRVWNCQQVASSLKPRGIIP